MKAPSTSARTTFRISKAMCLESDLHTGRWPRQLLMAAILWFPVAGALAQTSTITWESAGLANADVLTSGTTLSQDGVDMTLTWTTVTDGGSFVPFSSADFMTYRNGPQGGHMGYAAMAFDNGERDPDDKIIATLTFSPPVTLLTFSLLDIDTGSFDDGIEIFANGVNLKGNAAVTTGTAVGLDDETYMEGYEGIGTSVAPGEVFGNVDLDFGISPITTFRVEFFSTDDANLNPGGQVIGITDFTFGTPTRATIDSFAATLMSAGEARRVAGLAEPLAGIPDSDSVGLIRWTTAQEKGTIGFDLEGRDSPTDPWRRLNDSLLPGLVVSRHGGEYLWVDTEVNATTSPAEYRLLEREAWGSTLTHGPWASQSLGGGKVATSELRESIRNSDLEWWAWQLLGNRFAARGRSMPLADESAVAGRLALRRQATAVSLSAESATVFLDQVSTELSAPGRPRKSARLLTNEAGLYALAVVDLAAALDQPQGKVAARLGRGQIRFLAGGEPVAYAYDRATGDVTFALEAYRTLETNENVVQVGFGRGTVLQRSRGFRPSPGLPGQFREVLVVEEDVWLLPWANRDEGTDVWFWDFTFAPHTPSATLSFDVPDPVGSGAGTLRIALRGASKLGFTDDHRVSCSLNGRDLPGEVVWDGFNAAILETTFDQDLLGDGSNVVLTLHAQTAGDAPTSLVLIDDVEIEYDRRMRAVDGSLWVRRVGPGRITVEGFDSPKIRVVESPSDAAIAVERLDVAVSPDALGGWQVSFNAPRVADYLVTETIHSARIETDLPSSLTSENHNADYLIIAPRFLAEGAEALAAYRTSRFVTEIVWLEDIYDEFSHGRAESASIEAFLNHAYSTWHQPPRFVVLLGRGTLDPLDHQGYAENIVPIRLAATPWGLFQSDARYADVDGDKVPEVALGRLPVQTNDQLFAYLDKLEAFERSAGGAWRSRAAIVADNPDIAGDFHANSDELVAQLESFGWSADKLYHPLDPVRKNLLAGWSAGDWALISYDGHGAPIQLGSERYLRLTDVPNLTNSSRLPIFTAWTCAAGDSTAPGLLGLADSLVLSPAGGAIAAVSPAGLSLDAPAHALNLFFFDAAVNQQMTVGEANRDAHEAGSAASLLPWMLDIYLVSGDPALTLGD